MSFDERARAHLVILKTSIEQFRNAMYDFHDCDCEYCDRRTEFEGEYEELETKLHEAQDELKRLERYLKGRQHEKDLQNQPGPR